MPRHSRQQGQAQWQQQACLHTHHRQVVHKGHSWPRRMQSHHSSSPAHTEQQHQATSASTDCSKGLLLVLTTIAPADVAAAWLTGAASLLLHSLFQALVQVGQDGEEGQMGQATPEHCGNTAQRHTARQQGAPDAAVQVQANLQAVYSTQPLPLCTQCSAVAAAAAAPALLHLASPAHQPAEREASSPVRHISSTHTTARTACNNDTARHGAACSTGRQLTQPTPPHPQSPAATHTAAGVAAAAAALTLHPLGSARRPCWPLQPSLCLRTCCLLMLVAIILTSTRMVGVVCSQHTKRCTITLCAHTPSSSSTACAHRQQRCQLQCRLPGQPTAKQLLHGCMYGRYTAALAAQPVCCAVLCCGWPSLVLTLCRWC